MTQPRLEPGLQQRPPGACIASHARRRRHCCSHAPPHPGLAPRPRRRQVLRELAGDAALDRFRAEYEKVFRALKKSHDNEKRLIKKCRELNAEIVTGAAKVQAALKLSDDDQATIGALKKEIENSWRMVDSSHEKVGSPYRCSGDPGRRGGPCDGSTGSVQGGMCSSVVVAQGAGWMWPSPAAGCRLCCATQSPASSLGCRWPPPLTCRSACPIASRRLLLHCGACACSCVRCPAGAQGQGAGSLPEAGD